MIISGTCTFSTSAEHVWDLMLDPQVLLKIIPGLQTIEIKPNGEIIASATLGAGPLKGTFSGKARLLEQHKPTHVKIVGEGKGGSASIEACCIIDAREENDSTLIQYQLEVQLNGALARVGQPFVDRAINFIIRRTFNLLESAHRSASENRDPMEASNLAKAALTWDQIDINKVRQVAWSSIRYISQSFVTEFSGGVPLNLFVHQKLAERLGTERTNLRGVALVCGDMLGEKDFFEPDPILTFSEVDGFDISSVSIAKYQPKGIKFYPHVIDCNNIVLEKDKYHLGVASHGAHHVYNLGNLFYQANKSLKKNGLFYMAEWIGPKYLQIPRTNHILASLLLLTLFDRKTRTTHMGQVKGIHVQDPAGAFEPSEACDSTELMTQFLKYFKPIRIVYYAGLSYPIFEGIAQNIDQSTLGNQAKIKVVHHIEKSLTRLGIVKPLFVTALGERRELPF